MKKLIISFILLLTTSALNADYIPYNQIANYTYSMESGWRAGYKSEVVFISKTKGKLEFAISKKLYNELKRYKDYKNNLKITTWTASNGSKSYSYNVLLPMSIIDTLSHSGDSTIKIKNTNRSKICKGRTAINKEDGFIWCTVYSLNDLLKL